MPASVARLGKHGLVEVEVAGAIRGRGRQQCWRGRHCPDASLLATDVKPWASYFDISAQIKESSGGRMILSLLHIVLIAIITL